MAEDSRSTSRQPSRYGAGTPSTSHRPNPSASRSTERGPAADRPRIRAPRVAPASSRSMVYSTAHVWPSSRAVVHPSMRHPLAKGWKYTTSKPARASWCCHAAVAGRGSKSMQSLSHRAARAALSRPGPSSPGITVPDGRGRSWRRWGCHDLHVEDFESKAGDPLHELGERGLVGQVGAERSCARARGDRAVVELRAQDSVRLAGESDLVCV